MAEPTPTPIVLHHGLFGFGNFKLGPVAVSYFRGVDRALAERGHPLIVPRVHPTGSIERRAGRLKAVIERESAARGLDGRRVVVVAHSMGGLDARHMVTHLGMARRVAAIVTVSTPHRGSSYADWCLTHLCERLGAFKVTDLLGLDVSAVNDLTRDACARFNAATPDAAGVRYYSVAAARPRHRVAPVFYHSHGVVTANEGENDGLVSVASAQWGECLGTWAADHLHVIGRRLAPELLEPVTGDIAPYYLRAMDRLAADGVVEP